MKERKPIGISILKWFFSAILLWFVLYFMIGEKTALYFTSRTFAAIFPQILVFAAAVSIYVLFILAMDHQRKKWVNLSLFFIGLVLAILPFFLYHGYFQYRCGFWNEEIQSSKTLLVNQNNPSQTVQIIQSQCENTLEEKIDTVYTQTFTPFFQLRQNASIRSVENSNWMLPVHYKN